MGNQGTKQLGLVFSGAKGPDLSKKKPLLFRAPDPDHVSGAVLLTRHGLDASADTQAEQKGHDIVSQALTVGAQVDTVTASLARFARRDGTVGSPEMSQEEGDLLVAELEEGRWYPLFVRPLAKNPQIAQPEVDTRWMPAITIAAEYQLMPSPLAFMAIDLNAEVLDGGIRHYPTVGIGSRGIA